MSAILSTTDTRLHATGMTVARDIYSYLRPNATDDRLMFVSRTATVVLGLTATAAAVNPPGTIIFLYGLRAVVLTSAFLVPVYYAVFKSDADGRAVITAIASGAVVGLGTHLMGGGFGPIPSTFMGVGVATTIVLVGDWFLRGRATGSVA
jgi:Na+/proline symporter